MTSFHNIRQNFYFLRNIFQIIFFLYLQYQNVIPDMFNKALPQDILITCLNYVCNVATTSILETATVITVYTLLQLSKALKIYRQAVLKQNM